MDQEMIELLQGICHDLRSPVRAIRESCHRSEGPSQYIIDMACDQIVAVLNDLDAYMRTGINGNAWELVNLADCLTVAITALPIASKLKISTGSALPVIWCHKSQVVRLFQNLLGNAAKYAGPEASVTIQAVDKGNELEISFCDDGPGIPEHSREDVFRPMRRLHGWWDVPGSGLGLSICRRIVTEHGGRIWVESAPGGGACFKFTLSMEEPLAARPDQHNTKSDLPTQHITNRR